MLDQVHVSHYKGPVANLSSCLPCISPGLCAPEVILCKPIPASSSDFFYKFPFYQKERLCVEAKGLKHLLRLLGFNLAPSDSLGTARSASAALHTGLAQSLLDPPQTKADKAEHWGYSLARGSARNAPSLLAAMLGQTSVALEEEEAQRGLLDSSVGPSRGEAVLGVQEGGEGSPNAPSEAAVLLTGFESCWCWLMGLSHPSCSPRVLRTGSGTPISAVHRPGQPGLPEIPPTGQGLS